MNKILSLFFAISIFIISPSLELTAFSRETVDESIITPEWPVLHQALLRKQFDKSLRILEILPNQAKENSIGLNRNSFNTLELAIIAGAPLELIETLIALGADVNATRYNVFSEETWPNTHVSVPQFYTLCDYQEFRTPLLAAWIMQNHEVIELLINNGANPYRVIGELATMFTIGDGDYPHFSFKNESRWISLDDLMREFNLEANKE